MMLAIIIDAAVRTGVLALAVLVGVKALRIANPHVLIATWQLVLAASLAMPLMVGWGEISLPSAALSMPPLDLGPVSEAMALLPPGSAPVPPAAPVLAASVVDWRMTAGVTYWLGVALLLLRLAIGTALS